MHDQCRTEFHLEFFDSKLTEEAVQTGTSRQERSKQKFEDKGRKALEARKKKEAEDSRAEAIRWKSKGEVDKKEEERKKNEVKKRVAKRLEKDRSNRLKKADKKTFSREADYNSAHDSASATDLELEAAAEMAALESDAKTKISALHEETKSLLQEAESQRDLKMKPIPEIVTESDLGLLAGELDLDLDLDLNLIGEESLNDALTSQPTTELDLDEV